MTSIGTIVAAAASFLLTVIFGKVMIPLLRRLKFGQTIREDGPVWHKNKEGTPTMGGLIFMISIGAAAVAGYLALTASGWDQGNVQTLAGLFGGLVMAYLFGLVGFIDDYIKVVKKRNLGLNAKQKLLFQVLITAGYLAVLYAVDPGCTAVQIPFFGRWDFGWLYFPVMGVLIVGIVNSVNLTDGIDGLLSSITFWVSVFFMIATSLLGSWYLDMNLLAAAVAGGCVGFLFYNAHPAKVFMGDTGSMFLGGLVVALAFGIDLEFILFLAGFIYCAESLSVILQVLSVKLRGKRLFRMSPIHHHFEMGGMGENRIVFLFSIVTIVMCVIALLAVLPLRG